MITPLTDNSRASNGSKSRSVTRWPWILFGILQCFSLYQLFNHAMWRDELQVWSIVRESNSLSELFRNMRYEGFPPLWFLCLWGLSFIFTSPLAMQLFHYSCSLAAQLLLMTRAPFSGTMKLAIIAGYYVGFEYSIISRVYVLGMLLVFLFFSFQEWLDEHPVIRGGILGLLANTTVYGAILSLAFVADNIREAYGRRRTGAAAGNRSGMGMTWLILVYGILLIIAVAFMLPPDNGTYASGWSLQPDLTDKFYLLGRNLISLIPIPVPKIDFWNSLAAFDAGMWIAIPASIAVICAIWYALRDAVRYLLVFIMGFLGIWLFSVVKYAGTLRHAGAAMILFIACLWGAAESTAEKPGAHSPARNIAVWFILGANIVAWSIASYYHVRYNFSGSREMTQIIERTYGNRLPIVADTDYATSSIAGYLGRPLYYAANRKTQTYIRWNAERTEGGGELDTLAFADALSRNTRRVLLLLNYPLSSGSARLIAKTRDAIVKDEVFYLYEYGR